MGCKMWRKFQTSGLVALMAAFALGPQAAQAQTTLRISAGADYPTTVLVGQTNVAVSISAANDTTIGALPSVTESLTNMVHQVSCTTNTAECSAPGGENPPVFQIVGCPLAAPANVSCVTAVGAAGTACAGVTFDIQPTGNVGEYRFVPQSPVLLVMDSTPTDLERNCAVPFLVNVINYPVSDTNVTIGKQTVQTTRANAVIQGAPNDGQQVFAAGPDETTVNICTPSEVCRASAGVCDVQEICLADGTCPADGFVAATTECRASGGVCDVAESCTGASAACPADGFVAATTICRASGGVCDVAESCTGSAAACPADAFVPATTECRASAGVCDASESCTGSAAACPADVVAPATTICRNAEGVCDVAESCDGIAATCPTDGVAASTTICRTSNGVCDVPESCDGIAKTCAADGFVAATTECRAANGVCDVPESCTGTSAACPDNGFAASTTICRPVAAECDIAESCTGTGADCPVDVNPVCNDAVCRTVGYWGTHAGTEKGAVNVTQLAINLGGGSISVCGEVLNNTSVGSNTSALEALCDSGGGKTQLARQLTALAINCIATLDSAGQGSDCVGVPAFESIFTACNTICTSGTNPQINACVNAVDCLNNGGKPTVDAGGQFLCATGACSDNGADCTTGNLSLCATPGTATCTVRTETCHTNDLPSLLANTNAGSSDSCNAARKSACDIFDISCP